MRAYTYTEAVLNGLCCISEENVDVDGSSWAVKAIKPYIGCIIVTTAVSVDRSHAIEGSNDANESCTYARGRYTDVSECCTDAEVIEGSIHAIEGSVDAIEGCTYTSNRYTDAIQCGIDASVNCIALKVVAIVNEGCSIALKVVAFALKVVAFALMVVAFTFNVALTQFNAALMEVRDVLMQVLIALNLLSSMQLMFVLKRISRLTLYLWL